MNSFIGSLEVAGFPELLGGYKNMGILMRNCLDGGAGSGATAKEMLPYLQVNGKIFAFEPFIGNFRFLDACDPRYITVIKKALSSQSNPKRLYVESTVTKDSQWGKAGMEGYSSLGFLIADSCDYRPLSKLYTVECVRADDAISENHPIDFVKLDLQGGELHALKGMGRIIKEALFLWIEFTNQPGLLQFLHNEEFVIIDTTYIFFSNHTIKPDKHFHFIKNEFLSTGRPIWIGKKLLPWSNDFDDEFSFYKKKYGLIQTDIICVQKEKLALFASALKTITKSVPTITFPKCRCPKSIFPDEGDRSM